AANAGSRAEPPLFKLEMNWNQEELEQWAIAARQKEEDELTLEKYRRADDSKETMIRCRADVLDAIVYNAVRVDMTQRSATTSTLGQLLMYRLRICPFGKVTGERCELREDAHCCHIKPSDPDYGQFKGNASHMVPGWVVVDLDLPPEQRWAAAMKNAAEPLKKMITHFKSFVGVLSEELFKLIEDSPKFKKLAEQVLTDMGEYGLEMRGIANATGISEEEILFVNMMYEIEGGCTSIVAQDADGHVVHGRNLDFGLFFGEDWKHLQWTLTEDLRPLLRNVHFVRGKTSLYDSTVFL
ncbi:Asah1, partial [Symbiodinium necroappetens]